MTSQTPSPTSSARAGGAVPSADVLLADGRIAFVRSLRPDDLDAVRELHDRVSDEAIRMRFFSSGRVPAHRYLQQLAASRDTLALVAELDGRVVALATAEPEDAHGSEVAFLVDDDLHGLGLGSLLLEHLAAAAQEKGVRRFTADVLMENRLMLGVFLDAGFDAVRHHDGGVVTVELDTRPTSRSWAAADRRESLSEARSLSPLLRPRSVALTGVRSDGTGIGATVLRNIVAGGYAGSLHVVHPTATTLAGLPTQRRLVDVPAPLDLVIVAVRATAALETIRDAIAAGARAAVIISSGFQEMGVAGATLQHDVLALARAHSLRLVGPNCLGLLLNDATTKLNATFYDTMPPAGTVAVASQSGGVGIVLMDRACEVGLGVGTFVSLGNKADVSGNDLLAAWRTDPRVDVAVLYLESFGNARKFARVAREFSRLKPLLAVVGGRSAGGRRAGASHTAAAATNAVGIQALMAQAGVIACDDADDAVDTALFLTEQPRPRGRRVAILTNAGGMGVLAADAADAFGLEVLPFSDRLTERIGAVVQGTLGLSNPVDAGAAVDPRDLASIGDEILRSGEVDVLLVVLVATGVTDSTAAVAEVVRMRAGCPDLPVMLVPLGGLELPADGLDGVTMFRSTTAALRAVARVESYVAWLRGQSTVGADDREDALEVRAFAQALLLEDPERGWLSPSDLHVLLDGIAMSPAGEVVQDGPAALTAADELGYPVALKVADPSVVHKTDRGLVRVGLGSAAEVLIAARAFEAELGRPSPLLVQPVVEGTEIALGLVRDPGFGPMVMVAAGGVATEIWGDRVMLLPPVSRADAEQAIRSLRVWPLMDGFRGAPRQDVDALAALVVRLGELASDVPEIAELDLNPVVVGEQGCELVDVKVRLHTPAPDDRELPRQLKPLG